MQHLTFTTPVGEKRPVFALLHHFKSKILLLFFLLIILHLLQSNFRFETSGTVLHAYIAVSNMKL